MTDVNPGELAGQCAQTKVDSQFAAPVQAWRGKLTAGLMLYPLAVASFDVDHDTGESTDGSYDVQVNGASLAEDPVDYDTSNSQTAEDIADAINDNAANHRYVAVASTATVSIYQRRWYADGVAVTLTVDVTDDAAIDNLSDFDNDGAIAPIPVISGEANNIPDTHTYYELGVDTTTAYDLDGTPRAGRLDITTGASEDWAWWRGLFNGGDGHEVAGEAEETLPLPFDPNPALTGYIISNGGDNLTAEYILWSI